MKENVENLNSTDESDNSTKFAEEVKVVERHPLRNLLVFQFKLALDATRDLLLSPISFIVTLVDLIEGKKGSSSYFAKLMQLGRLSDNRINLFGQHDGEVKTVDSILKQAEDALTNEYKNGRISARTRQVIAARLRQKHQ